MMEEITIRKASANDARELAELKLEMWKSTYKGIYPKEKIASFNIEENTKKFLNIINNPHINLYVPCKDKKIIAYMDYGEPFRPFRDYKHEIGLLYILPTYQGYGLGKKLFHLAYQSMKEEGIKEFFISCNKYNLNAQKFYEKMGGKKIQIDEDNQDKSIPQIKYLYKID